MIVPDLNVLIHAVDSLSMSHEKAKRWWLELLSGNEAVGLCDVVLFGYIRLSTRRGIFAQPIAIADALAVVESWINQPNVEVLSSCARARKISFELLRSLGTGGNLTTDAQIAALALRENATVHSNDADMRRFAGLRVFNPLVG
jgi:uncharacterized protein